VPLGILEGELVVLRDVHRARQFERCLVFGNVSPLQFREPIQAEANDSVSTLMSERHCPPQPFQRLDLAIWGLSVLVVLPILSGCYTTQMGEHVKTTPLESTREQVDRDLDVDLTDPSSTRLDSVGASVRSTPTYEVLGVKKHKELRQKSTTGPVIAAISSTAALIFLYQQGCSSSGGRPASGSGENSCTTSTGVRIGMAASALTFAGASQRYRQARTDEPEPTGELIPGSNVDLREDGDRQGVNNKPVTISHGGTTRRYITDERGRLQLDLRAEFGVERLARGESVDLTVSRSEATESETLRISGPRRARPSLTNGSVSSAETIASRLPERLRSRFRQYYATVLEQARRFGVDPALVFAVIQAESAYVPTARSPDGAYGLMQLIPSDGGKTAHRLLRHGTAEEPSIRDLYRPEYNIKLGVVYLRFLLTERFSEVKNAQSRLYCAISAYNTGPENVARAFVPSDLNEAIRKINAMSAGDVQDQLQRSLPYRETQVYLSRVVELIPYYREDA